jgi:threonyl-tRNA synthetase
MSKPIDKSCSIKFHFFNQDGEKEEEEKIKKYKEIYLNSCCVILGACFEKLYESCLISDFKIEEKENYFFYDGFLEKKDLEKKEIKEKKLEKKDEKKDLEIKEIKEKEEIEKEENLNINDSEISNKSSISSKDFSKIENLMKKLILKKIEFEILEISIEEGLELFKNNKFKIEYIKENFKQENEKKIKIIKFGDFIDINNGLVLFNSSEIKNFKIYESSSCYYKGDLKKESLQRIYCKCFYSKLLLEEWLKFEKDIKNNDHRFIGIKQELWFSHKFSPGMYFLLPKGQLIFNNLVNFIKLEYLKRGYDEVQVPLIYNEELYNISGHCGKYLENMFKIEIDSCCNYLKPMNCPAHCLIFKNKSRSYKDLPLRLSDFSPLHRNEIKGALSGMTRVRKFQQDDSHIFCRFNQIQEEILGVLNFVKFVYEKFNFKMYFFLSTRPINFLGEIKKWDEAEKQLKLALENFGEKFEISEGDGAFYGPKIDILVEDSLKRKHQLATCQLDFVLPERFKLEFVNENSEGEKFERPVMIHKAVLGSLERFMAVLSENLAGKWPFWISPRPIIIIPISEKFKEYANQVKLFLIEKMGLVIDMDFSEKNFNKKIRNAQLQNYNFILIVGQKEMESNSVNIRERDNKIPIGEKSLKELIKFLKKVKKEFK